MKKLTRREKIAQEAKQRDWMAGRAADRALDPIRQAIDDGDLVITALPSAEVDPLSGREYCPRCASGPRQKADGAECPDCGYRWSGPRLLDIAESEGKPGTP